MSYAQKIKGLILQTVEKNTTNDDEITAGDLFELAIFFGGISKIYANNANRVKKQTEQIAETFGQS